MPEPQAKPLDPMAGLLLSIKSGSKNLKSVPAEALATKASKPVEVLLLLLYTWSLLSRFDSFPAKQSDRCHSSEPL